MENNIKELRLRAGLTQKELSKKSGLVQSKISEYEALERLDNITIGSIKKVAQALEVTVNDIIYPLPDRSYEDKVLDGVMINYAEDKEKAEGGDVDAAINNRFI
ncbi:MAG: helix-turn-helix domain-containing protein [Oscillospiraceae bacterium]|nr:helix-turn-helix domain-containing protein [Oscillospiraceae bacterium]